MSKRYDAQNSIAELLIMFVNTNLEKEDFLKRENALNNSSIQKEKLAIDLTDDELKHEYCHFVAWAKKGIRSSFYRNEFGDPVTIPCDKDFAQYAFNKKTTKQDIIKLYLDIVTVPENHGISIQ